MCGVVGYWGYSSQDLSESVFAAFTHSLAHRGPDGFGIEHFPEARLWLGHRRLAIVDLSERARQPMSYAEGRYWLTYNGEVYNYLELREELRGLGHRFVSHSDSEVILAAYAQWGPECQLRFNGMWAFAIWDARDRRLFLSRDRFGIKPLHYCHHAGAIAFASEVKAFLTLPWIDGAFDPEILAETLANIDGCEASPYTLLPGVRRLPAGHAMLVEADGRVQINAWWNTLDHLPRPRASLNDQAEEFRALLFDACRLRLRSDVPLATALSGGLDSSAIACTLAELGRRGAVEGAPKDWQRAFVACFPGTPYDERQYAKAVVDHTGIVPHYLDIDDHKALSDIEKVIFDQEAIYWFASVGPWALYRAMRTAGIRVSIDGHGSDELIGGYISIVKRAIEAAGVSLELRRYLDLRRVLAGLIGGPEVSGYGSPLGALRLWSREQLARLRLLEPARAMVAGFRSLPMRVHGSTAASDSAVEQLLPHYDGPNRLYYGAADARVTGMSPLQATLFTNFHGTSLPNLLCNFDRASMSHGIEVRIPFMDWRLVTYCFALPETSKIGGGYTKRVLREAMRGLLPESIRLRTKKIGFVTPTEVWTRGALKPWLLDLSASRSFIENSVWNGPAARAAVERAVDGKASIGPVWPILNAYVLEQSFKARARSATLNESTLVPRMDIGLRGRHVRSGLKRK
jgi:asparagine synthase (glutamine-hydrolysing)